jgi:hypothetical protein
MRKDRRKDRHDEANIYFLKCFERAYKYSLRFGCKICTSLKMFKFLQRIFTPCRLVSIYRSRSVVTPSSGRSNAFTDVKDKGIAFHRNVRNYLQIDTTATSQKTEIFIFSHVVYHQKWGAALHRAAVSIHHV